jgi:hypothetical protein
MRSSTLTVIRKLIASRLRAYCRRHRHGAHQRRGEEDRAALDRLDPSRVADAAAREEQLDASLRAVLRELITYMIEDPRLRREG